MAHKAPSLRTKARGLHSDLIYELTKGSARLLLVGMFKQKVDEDDSLKGVELH